MARREMIMSRALAARVSVSRSISWAMKSSFLPDAVDERERAEEHRAVALQAHALLVDVHLLADEGDLFEDALGVGLDVQVLELGEQVRAAFAQALRHALLDGVYRVADLGDALPQVADQGRAFGLLHLDQPAQGLGDDGAASDARACRGQRRPSAER